MPPPAPRAKKSNRNGNPRYLKQAIVDKNALVSSSALVSGILLYKISPEVSYENRYLVTVFVFLVDGIW